MRLRLVVITGVCLPIILGQAFSAEPDDADTQMLIDKKSHLEEQFRKIQNELSSLDAELKTRSSENETTMKSVILPEYVKMIGTGESGFNHSNPSWTNDGKLLGFERHDERNKEIVIVDNAGNTIQTVKYINDENDDLGLELLLPEFAENVSYNAGLSWSPDNSKFVYMSNGSEGNYDLYLGNVGNTTSARLTKHNEKDGHAHWSPANNSIAFISGRNGSANIYLLDVTTNGLKPISSDNLAYLYPQWSPNGNQLAVIYGTNQNHDINIYSNILEGKPKKRTLISWKQDDLRPIWSPNGKKLAFYTNYNEENDPNKWSIAVVDKDSKELSTAEQIVPLIVARDVVPDIDKGPAWMPDSQHIVYVKNNRKKYNPIELTNIQTKQTHSIKTKTNINHDINVSANGIIAFRSQVDQWDHIFMAKIPPLNSLTNTISHQDSHEK